MADARDFIIEEVDDIPTRYLTVGDLDEAFTDNDLKDAIRFLINHPRHKNTTTLDILGVNSQITRIPDEISELEKLKILHIVGHKSLRQLPETISQLQELKELNVSENDLRGLPNSFYPSGPQNKLQKLKTLNISDNPRFTKVVPVPNIRNAGVDVIFDNTPIEAQFDIEQEVQHPNYAEYFGEGGKKKSGERGKKKSRRSQKKRGRKSIKTRRNKRRTLRNKRR
jgi:hypothetical protein